MSPMEIGSSAPQKAKHNTNAVSVTKKGGLRIALSFCSDLLYCADIPDSRTMWLTLATTGDHHG